MIKRDKQAKDFLSKKEKAYDKAVDVLVGDVNKTEYFRQGNQLKNDLPKVTPLIS